VFIDETAVTTKMTRLYGRAPRGERLVAKVPHGHWKTLTLVAALRAEGVTAPYVIDGAMDGRAFLAYVEQVLVPTLKKRDIVFMDNVRTHKVAGVACVRPHPGFCRRRQGGGAALPLAGAAPAVRADAGAAEVVRRDGEVAVLVLGTCAITHAGWSKISVSEPAPLGPAWTSGLLPKLDGSIGGRVRGKSANSFRSVSSNSMTAEGPTAWYRRAWAYARFDGPEQAREEIAGSSTGLSI
jgi:hypothetical protein